MTPTDSMQAAYEAQIDAMATAARHWLDDHPDHEVRFHVHAPPGALVATITDARNFGLVTLNEDAEYLVKAMVAVEPDPKREPTVSMVAQALDAARRVTR